MRGLNRNGLLLESFESCSRRAVCAISSVILAGVLGMVTAGCGDEFLAPATETECREVASQCRLPGGPLGVCERRTCHASEAPPCFTCTPQH